MKTFITLVIIFICLFLFQDIVLFAADPPVATTTWTITGEIATDKTPTAKALFLRAQPMPLNEDGTDKYTFTEWMSNRVWIYVKGEIREGGRLLAKDEQNDIDIK